MFPSLSTVGNTTKHRQETMFPQQCLLVIHIGKPKKICLTAGGMESTTFPMLAQCSTNLATVRLHIVALQGRPFGSAIHDKYYFVITDCTSNQFVKKLIMIVISNLDNGAKLSGWLRDCFHIIVPFTNILLVSVNTTFTGKTEMTKFTHFN